MQQFSDLRFRFLSTQVCITLTLWLSCWSINPACAAPPHPNIVLMMADDMGMGDTSAYQDITGNNNEVQIHTPSMDRLARMGMRFTDAHTPSSRCTGTRYGLLTGRYPWRSRLKHWVLFGVQGDPLIERDRPTIASLLKDHGYQTGMVGKWHVGLRYRRSDGSAADAWNDADLSQPMFDTPLDHGFDYCWFTSRSHGTSGAATDGKKVKNSPMQSVGPGHIHGRTIVSATGNGKQLKDDDDPDGYVLTKLGGRHSRHSIEFINSCVKGSKKNQPFFLYYASNSNHAPYTPDKSIAGKDVKGASRNVAGEKMKPWIKPKSKKQPSDDLRHDFVYENDVVLGRLIDHLKNTDDPRNPGHPLFDNTIVIFTSDNGAERKAKYATGPFRSNKGSAYEGGHRVPFIVTWPNGGVGDGNDSSLGKTSDILLGLQDMFASFSDVIGATLPDLRGGQKGGEDSTSMLAAWRGKSISRGPIFHNDHNEAKDAAAVAIRSDRPMVNGTEHPGKWKLFFDANLIRRGIAEPTALYDLSSDPQETNNRLSETALAPLVAELSHQARLHRNCGGHRYASFSPTNRITASWTDQADTESRTINVTESFRAASASDASVSLQHADGNLEMRITATRSGKAITKETFHLNQRGLGVGGGEFGQVDEGEAISIQFNRDVIIDSVAIVAGNGNAGGWYQKANSSPMAIYCVDDDIDSNDQSGVLSDIGVLKAGESLRLNSSPHHGVEIGGRWRLQSLSVRVLKE